ncbi:Ammonium transporter Rh type B-A [Lamellibrachia satsuma]|nr:Ammonium transporter Rh type B-A [Lamellibrachia satsuma]
MRVFYYPPPRTNGTVSSACLSCVPGVPAYLSVTLVTTDTTGLRESTAGDAENERSANDVLCGTRWLGGQDIGLSAERTGVRVDLLPLRNNEKTSGICRYRASYDVASKKMHVEQHPGGRNEETQLPFAVLVGRWLVDDLFRVSSFQVRILHVVEDVLCDDVCVRAVSANAATRLVDVVQHCPIVVPPPLRFLSSCLSGRGDRDSERDTDHSEKLKMASRGKFTIIMMVLQAIFIVLFGIFVRYSKKDEHGEPVDNVKNFYPMFKDVHVMIFVGFGFLMTFLKKYGYGSIGFNLLLGAVVIQWATLIEGFFMHSGSSFSVSIETIINADFAAAAVLISFGAVLGKTSALQLVMMAVCEIVLYHLNIYIGTKYYKAADIGGSMFIHVFGAYFGLAFSLVIYRKDVKEAEDDAGSVYHSDIFSMIGTVFLWMFWPSFNAALATGDGQYRAVINTYYSLAACTVVSFGLSSLVNKGGKIDMVHIQNATLAGGVAVGTAADMVIHPYGALVIGSGAAVVSVLGYQFLTPLLDSKIRLNDTCGVNNLHGMPGLLAAIVGIIASAFATKSAYGETNLYEVFPGRAPANATILADESRSAGVQAAYQAATVGTTLLIAVVGGLVTGKVIVIIIMRVERLQV